MSWAVTILVLGDGEPLQDRILVLEAVVRALVDEEHVRAHAGPCPDVFRAGLDVGKECVARTRRPQAFRILPSRRESAPERRLDETRHAHLLGQVDLRGGVLDGVLGGLHGRSPDHLDRVPVLVGDLRGEGVLQGRDVDPVPLERPPRGLAPGSAHGRVVAEPVGLFVTGDLRLEAAPVYDREAAVGDHVPVAVGHRDICQRPGDYLFSHRVSHLLPP